MTEAKYEFDYTNQAWLKDGRYVRCPHRTCVYVALCPWDSYTEVCRRSCFGTRHVGERPNLTAEVR